MITIPAEVLFDVLRDEEVIKFTEGEIKYYFYISDKDYLWRAYEDMGCLHINITKVSFMKLLLNRVFVCEEYELKIGL